MRQRKSSSANSSRIWCNGLGGSRNLKQVNRQATISGRLHRTGVQMKSTPAQKGQRKSFFSQDEIKGLYKFVRERLAYHEAIGELNPGDIAVEDIADTVL